MFPLIVLFLVIIILCFTLVPALLKFYKKSTAFLKKCFLTLVVLFVTYTIGNNIYNYFQGVYYSQSYKTMYSWVTGGNVGPIQKTITYADANKSWVLAMIIIFTIMMTHFSRK